MRTPLLNRFASIGLVGLLAACSDTRSPEEGTLENVESRPLATGQSRLVVDLVDAPNREVKEINVTIRQVTAHAPKTGWVTVMSGPAVTVDLLKLQTESLRLGFAELPAGKVTQIRLYVDEAGPNYVVLPSGEEVALKVPSGPQSGIKVKGTVQLASCTTNTVTLDFDGKKSIHVHPTGQGDLWILRPVIHLKKQKETQSPCTDGSPDGGINEEPGSGDGSGDGEGDGSSGSPGSPAGAACEAGTDCLSGACSEGICEQGGAGAACNAPTDCASNECTEEGTCAPTASAGGAGSACTGNLQCLSNVCTEGVCEAGSQGAPCAAPTDCAEGFACNQGQCAPVIQ